MATAQLELPIVIDEKSAIFLFTVRIISLSVFLFSKDYINLEKFTARFHRLVIVFVKSIFCLILIPNFIGLLIGWDGLGVSSFLLVIYFYSNKSINAGLLTLFTNRVGDVFLIATIGFYSKISSWEYWISTNYYLLPPLVLFFVILAACTKRAQIPFSSWLPAAMAAPTPVSSLVHSSTLVTAGVYILIRWSIFVNFYNFILTVGTITLFMARIRALFETDIKKIIALSTLSQLGLIFMSIGLKLNDLAFLHLILHAFFKALMFITVGNFIHISSDYQDIRAVSLRPLAFQLTFTFALISNLSLIGIPFLGGFFSKDVILEICVSDSLRLMFILLFFSSLTFTVAYRIRFLHSVYIAPIKFVKLNLAQEPLNSTSFGINLLSLLVIIGRSYLSFALQFNQTIVIVPTEIKLIILIFLILGRVMENIMSNLLSKNSFRLGSMFALPFFFGNWSKFITLQSSSLLHKIDNTWTLWLPVKRVKSYLSYLNLSFSRRFYVHYTLITFFGGIFLFFFT